MGASAVFQQAAVLALGFAGVQETGKSAFTFGLLGNPGAALGQMLQAQAGAASSFCPDSPR